jgi:hypothetical protein
MKIAIPEDDMKPFKLDLDNAVFDPNAPDPARYGTWSVSDLDSQQ